ncbi:MAG: class I SAM-dependent methyltransferase [Saprospiraceae bacterium]|nr:class I SAM-dependent methyltransferase [Saprospiraceae bacterium]MDZ4704874.1 class I SAM-dependent methyltransferase [Saprospiraceae bacterium]
MRLFELYILSFFRYLRYYFWAHTKYDVHSPYVADFLEHTCGDDRWFYVFSTAEILRKRLLQDRTKLAVTDLGAGSAIFDSNHRRLCDVVSHTAISPALGRLLFRIVYWHKPATLLELGTSVGISAIYQASAALEAAMITIEGDPALAQLARGHLQEAGLEQVKVVEGDFQVALPGALQVLKKLDYLYVDGDHRADRTLAYFNQCMAFAHEGSLFVFADIHWSSDMERAWETIRRDPRVTISVDLYDFGLLFFRKENKEQQHFTLIRAKWKPWRMGFF